MSRGGTAGDSCAEGPGLAPHPGQGPMGRSRRAKAKRPRDLAPLGSSEVIAEPRDPINASGGQSLIVGDQRGQEWLPNSLGGRPRRVGPARPPLPGEGGASRQHPGRC
jgi:hypothetical protein